MDFLIRDCILCPITNVLQKKTNKMIFFGLSLLLLLSTLEINHCGQNNSHHRFYEINRQLTNKGYSVYYK